MEAVNLNIEEMRNAAEDKKEGTSESIMSYKVGDD